MERKHLIAKAEIVFSMAVFGTISIFVRNIPLPSAELALCRAVIAAATLLIWQILTRTMVRFQDIKKELPLLLLSGAAMGVNWILFFQAYKYTSVALATLSYYFAPVLVTVASPLLFQERLTGRQMFCFVMSTLGLVLVIGVSGGAGAGDTAGVLFGLGAAVFYAAVVLCNKGIRNVTGINRTYLQFLASIAVLLPYVLFTGGFHLAGASGQGPRKPSGGGRRLYGDRIHSLFLVPALSEGAGGGDLKLHRPAGGRAGVGDRAGGVRHLAAGGRRSHDSGLHHPE